MKKGNKAQRAQKNREKRSLNQTHRAAARPVKPQKAKPMSPKKLQRKMKAEERARMAVEFTDQVYLPWLAQGINYLVSDYDQGRWEMLLQDQEPQTPEEIARRVLVHFGDPASGTYEDLLMQVCIAWTVLPQETHYTYWREAQRRLALQAPQDDTLPNSVVWAWMNEIKQFMMGATHA